MCTDIVCSKQSVLWWFYSTFPVNHKSPKLQYLLSQNFSVCLCFSLSPHYYARWQSLLLLTTQEILHAPLYSHHRDFQRRAARQQVFRSANVNASINCIMSVWCYFVLKRIKRDIRSYENVAGCFRNHKIMLSVEEYERNTKQIHKLSNSKVKIIYHETVLGKVESMFSLWAKKNSKRDIFISHPILGLLVFMPSFLLVVSFSTFISFLVLIIFKSTCKTKRD